jgi:Tol biopolymer transport system component
MIMKKLYSFMCFIVFIIILSTLVSCNQTIDSSNNITSINNSINQTPELKTNESTVNVAESDSINDNDSALFAPTGEILFSSERGGDRDLYTINADGTNLKLLLDLPSIEGHGDWAPDGNQIVFFSDMSGNRELYKMDISKEIVPIRLTDSAGMDHLPDWSPDGDSIVFESTRTGSSQLFIMSSDGTNLRQLSNTNSKNKAPVFSPDGKAIAFTAWVNGYQHMATINLDELMTIGIDEYPTIHINDRKNTGYIGYLFDGSKVAFHGKVGSRTQVHIMNSDGTDEQQLSNDTKRTLWVPVFSPDGQWIAYDSEGSFSTGEIYIMDIEGNNIIQVTDDPSSDWGPDWRPVSQTKKILFDSDIDGDREIYTVDEDGSNIIQLTDNKTTDGLAFWSPDNNRIVYFSDQDGDDDIYTMNSDGSNKTQLTFNETNDRAATWSHDGQTIAFVSSRTGNQEIFIMNHDGSNQRQLTFNSTKDFWPAFTPDDEYITYTTFYETQDTYLVKVSEEDDSDMPIPILLRKDTSRCEYSPDGTKIAFSSKVNLNWDIYVMNNDGSNVTRITHSTKNEWVPTWSADGNSLLFSRESGYKASIIMVNLDTLEEKVILPNDSQNWRPLMMFTAD